VKFLIDAQLPWRLAMFLADAGHDVVHTRELSEGNRTTDGAIADIADRDGRVVVTKDRDFRDGHLLGGTPQRLLVVATGNITNVALLGPADPLQRVTRDLQLVALEAQVAAPRTTPGAVPTHRAGLSASPRAGRPSMLPPEVRLPLPS
jgi:predicted nuclease of predicted toxin-antitoxin system